MTIGNGINTFMNGQRNWQIHNTRIATAIERISSGKRINRAADGVADMGISERMKMQLTMLSRQQDIMADYISTAEIADGKFANMQDIVLRLTELATQSANGTFTDFDRELLNKEYQSLIDELGGMSDNKMPNMPNLFSEKSNIFQNESFEIKGDNVGAYLNGLNGFLDEINNAAIKNDNAKLDLLLGAGTKHLSNSERLQKAVIEFTQKNGQALLNSKGGSDISGSVKLENGRLSIGFSPDDKNVYGLRGTDIKTADNAREAMADIKKASNAISKKRADTGTLYNMYDRTRQRLMNMETNLTASFSRLTDADIAKEMMTFVKEQVLSQASMFVMAQGRHQVEDILALLKT